MSENLCPCVKSLIILTEALGRINMTNMVAVTGTPSEKTKSLKQLDGQSKIVKDVTSALDKCTPYLDEEQWDGVKAKLITLRKAIADRDYRAVATSSPLYLADLWKC